MASDITFMMKVLSNLKVVCATSTDHFAIKSVIIEYSTTYKLMSGYMTSVSLEVSFEP